MKNKLFQKALCMLLSVTLLLSAVGFSSAAASESPKTDMFEGEEFPYIAPSLEDMQSLVGALTYEEYLANYGDLGGDVATPPTLDILDFEGSGEVVEDSDSCNDSMSETPEEWEGFTEEDAKNSVYLPATGSTTWRIPVSKEQVGLYYIKIVYYNCITDESSVSTIERSFTIDGKIPFKEVATIDLAKNWKYDNISKETFDAKGEEDFYDIEYHYGDGYDAYYKIVTSIKDGVKTVTTYKMSQDIIGNSMAPGASAVASWNTYYVSDSTGYYSGYFNFFLSEGTHTFTLEAERDPVIIKSIEFEPVTETTELPSYKDILAGYKDKGYKPAVGGDIIYLEAEFPDRMSDASVAPANDNTSAITYPVIAGTQLYNVIGETSYSSVGQWASYKFQVTKTGLYNLAMRYKQAALQGMFVCRAVKLAGGDYGLPDGTPTLPFAEANNTQFNYNENWSSSYLGDGTDTFTFYFEEGVEYTLYLECSLGTLKNYIQRVETSLTNVNNAYLQILQLTGTDPDEYRDYKFLEIMPEVLIAFLEEAVALMEVKAGLEELCGTNGSHIASLETIAILLNTMGSNSGDNIAANMATLKSNLGTLGTWINDSKASSITVDAIYVIPSADANGAPDMDKLPRAEANFFEAAWLEICAFFSSFFTDYDKMGLTATSVDEAESIAVWLATGRDQSQIWRTMIDAHSGFSDSTGTGVALKLVSGGTLLPSILSRKGPDVYLGQGAADVINYAIRDAIVGVSGNDVNNLDDENNAVFKNTYYTYKYDDRYETTTEYREADADKISFTTNNFENVVNGNFSDAAMDTLTLLDVTYGLPQTMGFAMMFYRMDVLADIGREVPQSWDDLLRILPLLQANNMNIGVSYISALDFMIYQKGGNMWKYTDDSVYSSEYAGARIDLDSNVALEAFEFTCKLYSEHSFPVSFDAANRFRTGEMPIVIGDYASIYNTLTVYATEISGLWEFCSLPGSYREDGSFSYDALAGVGATVILNGCAERGNMLHAWQFLQWQTGETAQADYGNKMVALIGPSAKYETANLKAINNLSWTASEKAAIMNQMTHMSSIVNYPGSYIITRYIQFAFLDAVNDKADAVDSMKSYIDAINSEIARKREEFELWVPASPDDEPPQLSKSAD